MAPGKVYSYFGEAQPSQEKSPLENDPHPFFLKLQLKVGDNSHPCQGPLEASKGVAASQRYRWMI